MKYKKAIYVGTVSGNKTDKSSVFSYKTAETGAPIIDEASVVMECGDEKINYGVLKPVLFDMLTYQDLRTGEIIIFTLSNQA